MLAGPPPPSIPSPFPNAPLATYLGGQEPRAAARRRRKKSAAGGDSGAYIVRSPAMNRASFLKLQGPPQPGNIAARRASFAFLTAFRRELGRGDASHTSQADSKSSKSNPNVASGPGPDAPRPPVARRTTPDRQGARPDAGNRRGGAKRPRSVGTRSDVAGSGPAQTGRREAPPGREAPARSRGRRPHDRSRTSDSMKR